MDLTMLETQIAGSDANRPVSRRELVWALRRLRDLFSAGGLRMDAIETRIGTLETTRAALTITVVANQNALPASAGVRQWFRVQGDPGVYVGNGGTQPLTKLTPT